MDTLTYVLVTPARNEAQFIGLTLKSVVRQTARPARWVIVSDGSTDGTDDIVTRYAARYPWIELIRQPERADRNFAGKVRAFNAGHARLQGLDYDVIGNLDGDISFEDDNYFEIMLGKFAADPRLGVAGTPYHEGSRALYDYRFSSLEDVAGACQLFRRQCFEGIGGYRPVRGGGIDLIAVLSARAQGWHTRTFTDTVCQHHRAGGSAQSRGVWQRLLRLGEKDYRLGSHPVFEVFRSVYQMRKRPYVVGGVLMFVGYFSSLVRQVERNLPEDLIAVRRHNQMHRLKQTLRCPPV
jgi:glycosyltransferase involved in cell wall biosynthesis